MDDEHNSERSLWDQDVVDKFVKYVFADIAAQKHRDPETAIRVAERLRGYLDNFVQSASEELGDGGRNSGYASGLSLRPTEPAGNGYGDAGSSVAAQGSKRKDALGRNFLSQLRALVVLEFLNIENRPIALHEVQALVAEKGFGDSESAVISQLHRLNQSGFIEKPNNAAGVYSITQAGRRHLSQLCETHGPMLEEWLGKELG